MAQNSTKIWLSIVIETPSIYRNKMVANKYNICENRRILKDFGVSSLIGGSIVGTDANVNKKKGSIKRKTTFKNKITNEDMYAIYEEFINEENTSINRKITKAHAAELAGFNPSRDKKNYINFYEQLGIDERNPEIDRLFKSIYVTTTKVFSIVEKRTTLYSMLKKSRNESASGRKKVGIELEKLYELALKYETIKTNGECYFS